MQEHFDRQLTYLKRRIPGRVPGMIAMQLVSLLILVRGTALPFPPPARARGCR